MSSPFGGEITVPQLTDERVISFAREVLGRRVQLYAVPVRREGEFQKLDCFNNVERYIEQHGGSRRYGWVIWQHGDSMIEAEFHEVWLSPSSELIDITPHDGETEIVFALDKQLRYTGEDVFNKRRLWRTDPEAVEIMESIEQYDELRAQLNGPPAARSALVPHNGLCPCGSGNKYRKCCARLNI